ncbi:MAG: TetR/AcrR family transcriptional regulator [Candidatus Binatia bacterium]
MIDPAAVGTPGRRGPGRPPYDSAETREMLVGAAEELFATLGVEAVSIRSINAAAGLAPAAVHYHFYSKDRLVDAVIRRRGEAAFERMSGLLANVEAGRKRPTVRALVDAIAIPYREMLERDPVGGSRWQRFIARLVLSQDQRLRRLTAGSQGLDARFLRALCRTFPEVPAQTLEAGWRIAITTLIQMLGNSDARLMRAVGEREGQISTAYGDMLVEFVAAGFASLIAAHRRTLRRKPPHTVTRVRSARRKRENG